MSQLLISACYVNREEIRDRQIMPLALFSFTFTHEGEVWAKREDEMLGWDVDARPGLTQRGIPSFHVILSEANGKSGTGK